MSNPAKYRNDFMDELERSIIAAALKARQIDARKHYDLRQIRSYLVRLYNDLHRDPYNSSAEVIHRLYRVRDLIISPEWDFESFLTGPMPALMKELDMHYRDAETVRDICLSIRRTSGHLSS